MGKREYIIMFCLWLPSLMKYIRITRLQLATTTHPTCTNERCTDLASRIQSTEGGQGAKELCWSAFQILQEQKRRESQLASAACVVQQRISHKPPAIHSAYCSDDCTTQPLFWCYRVSSRFLYHSQNYRKQCLEILSDRKWFEIF